MKKIFSLVFILTAIAGFSQAPDNGPKTVVASGTDTYTIVGTSPAQYTLGEKWAVKFTNANTGAATLNRSSKGAKAIKKNGTTALSAGDIPAGAFQLLVYDGTNFQCTTCGGSGGGGWATTTLTGPVVITESSSNTVQFVASALGVTQTDGAGLWLRNTTAATNILQQYSPSLTYETNGWSGSVSQNTKFRNFVYPDPVNAGNFKYTWKTETAGGPARELMYLGYAELGSFNPYLVIGTASLSSGNGAIYVANRIDGNGTGAGHGFCDNSLVTRGGPTGYAAFDSKPNFGSANSYIDYVGLQSRPDINTDAPSVLQNAYGLFHITNLTGGNVTNSFAGYAANSSVSLGGSIDNQYGFYTENLTSAATNYAFYAAGTTQSFLGGKLTVGATNNLVYDPSTNNLNITTVGTGGSLNFKYSGTTYASVFMDGGSSSVGLIAGTGYSLILSSNNVEAARFGTDGKLSQPTTVTAGGTTGAQTINKATGTVNFAAGASSLVVTNSLCTTSSLVFAVVRTNDGTALIKNIVPGSGSFTIRLNANATAETSVGFWVIN